MMGRVSTCIDAYLDVISLYSHCLNFNTDKLNVSLVKSEKILAVNPNALKDNCGAVVKDDGTGIMPKDFLRDTICQFFMIKTYKGIFDNSVLISPFTDAALENHHVIPLGSLVYPDEKTRKSEESLRERRDYFLK